MAVTKIIPVIMSGGSGTRLWPLSTSERPKQFHRLGAPRTLIAETVLRLSGRHGEIEFLPPVIIAGAAHADLVAELLAQAGVTPSAVVLEPEGRNTAATAALAALVAAEIDPDAHVLLAPADHIVARPEALIAAIKAAVPVVSERIVTFGIKPTGPETGYGYILQADAISPGIHHLAEFREKPDLQIAEQYVRDGRYSWNSGMFFFSPALLLEEFGIAAADIRDSAREALARAERKGRDILLHAPSFATVRKEAVDRAVMEKTKRAAVAPCDIGWADIGSWAELWRQSEKDQAGNAISGPVIAVGATNNLIRSEGIQVSVLGVSDLVIVAHGNSVLVMPRSLAQDVKKVIPDQS